MLVAKLVGYNFSPWVIAICWTFLHNRQQRVRVDESLSVSLVTSRGIPQATVLGHVLFSLMIYDISQRFTQSTDITKYADDQTLCYNIPKGLSDNFKQ